VAGSVQSFEAIPSETAALRKKGVVAYPEDIGVTAGKETLSARGKKSMEDLVAWSVDSITRLHGFGAGNEDRLLIQHSSQDSWPLSNHHARGMRLARLMPRDALNAEQDPHRVGRVDGAGSHTRSAARLIGAPPHPPCVMIGKWQES